MISIKKSPLKDPTWRALVRAGLRGGRTLNNEFTSGKEIKVNDDLYKRYMPFLLILFSGKCAYCETKLSSNQPGDVEHFRPKGRVVGDDFKPIRINHPVKGEIDHPGYFWLAYRWSNLFPACIDCNRYRKHGETKDAGAGKADRFPVEGFRACCPGQERKEVPLLVNPSEESSKHFEFMPDGTIRARSKAGEETLRILGLNRREALVEQRKNAYGDAVLIFRDYLNSVSTGDSSTVRVQARRLNAIWLGREAYTAMQRLALEHIRERNALRRINIPMPLPED